ncbi:MAG: hypothetical protein LLF94_07775 [Chlamydiales bacterium]|nr:hypothetical protein [Chlamydiales bacterium]
MIGNNNDLGPVMHPSGMQGPPVTEHDEMKAATEAMFGVKIPEGATLPKIEKAKPPTLQQAQATAIGAKALNLPRVVVGGVIDITSAPIQSQAKKISPESHKFVEGNFQSLPPAQKESYTKAKMFLDKATDRFQKVTAEGRDIALKGIDLAREKGELEKKVASPLGKMFQGKLDAVNEKVTENAKQAAANSEEKKVMGSTLAELNKTYQSELQSATQTLHSIISDAKSALLVEIGKDTGKSEGVLPFRMDSPHLTTFNTSWKASFSESGLDGEINKAKASFKDPFKAAEEKPNYNAGLLRSEIKTRVEKQSETKEKDSVDGIIAVLHSEAKVILQTVITGLEKNKDSSLQQRNSDVLDMSTAYKEAGNKFAENPEKLTVNSFCLRVLCPLITGDMQSGHNIALGSFLQINANLFLDGKLEDAELNAAFSRLAQVMN